MSEPENPPADLESADARKVQSAVNALESGDMACAEALLLEVIRNCPSDYVYEQEKDGSLYIKFWDHEEFVHFVLWQQNQGRKDGVIWTPCAYPMAYYYLGLLYLKTDRPEQAISLADQGQALEPTTPKFSLLKGQALIRLRRFEEALGLYKGISEVNRYVSPRSLAAVCRGRAFVLVETGNLDLAEKELRKSLKYEPQSTAARDELAYIENVRSGRMQPEDTECSYVDVTDTAIDKCAICGKKFQSGKVMEEGGKMTAVCNDCLGKDRPWWQFWKGRYPR